MKDELKLKWLQIARDVQRGVIPRPHYPEEMELASAVIALLKSHKICKTETKEK